MLLRISFVWLLPLLNVSMVSAALFERPEYCDKNKQRSPILWRIKRSPPSYFFGTIHVPYTEVWEHIDPVTKAMFRRADEVFFELDLNNPQTLHALAICQLLPKGEHISHYLPSNLYSRLRHHFAYVKAGLANWINSDQQHANYVYDSIAGNWELKRPVWIMLLLQTLTKSDMSNRGLPVLDLYLAQEAELLAKPSGAIEDVSEQCSPLNNLNLTQVIFALNQTLLRHERLRSGDPSISVSTTQDLVKHYNCGDLDAVVFSKDTYQLPELASNSSKINAEAARQAEEIDRYFRRELIDKRNIRMADRVAHLLKTHPDTSFFFAFGAGHFMGSDSVIDLVHKKHDIKVEPVIFKSSKRARPGKRKPGRRLRPLSKSFSSNFYSQPIGWRSKYDRWTKKEKLDSTSSADRTKDGRTFNELWVRMKDFTTKPWQEIDFRSETLRPQTSDVQYFIVMPSSSNSFFQSQWSNWLTLLSMLLMRLMCRTC